MIMHKIHVQFFSYSQVFNVCNKGCICEMWTVRSVSFVDVYITIILYCVYQKYVFKSFKLRLVLTGLFVRVHQFRPFMRNSNKWVQGFTYLIIYRMMVILVVFNWNIWEKNKTKIEISYGRFLMHYCVRESTNHNLLNKWWHSVNHNFMKHYLKQFQKLNLSYPHCYLSIPCPKS